MVQETENGLFRLGQRVERLEAAVADLQTACGLGMDVSIGMAYQAAEDAVLDDHAELLRRLEDELAAMTKRAEDAERRMACVSNALKLWRDRVGEHPGIGPLWAKRDAERE